MFKNVIRKSTCVRYIIYSLAKRMSNIEYLRQLHHKKIQFEKDSIPRKGVLYRYEKDLVFGFCVKGLIDLHILRSRKEPGLWTIYNAW